MKPIVVASPAHVRTLIEYRDATRRDHMDYLAWLCRGDAAEEQGHTDEAVSSFLIAAALLLGEGRHDSADRLARYVLFLKPGYERALALLAAFDTPNADA